MGRWLTYIGAFGLLLAFVLGMKHLAYMEGGSFGQGFIAGGCIMTAVMILGLWLQEREFKRQSERDDL